MKTTKLIIGVVSIVLFALIAFQSCAAGISNSLEENGEIGGSAGLILAFCMLIAGIVGLATRNGKNSGAYAAGGFYLAGGLLGFVSAGSYTDLNIWSGLAVAFGLVFILGTKFARKKDE